MWQEKESFETEVASYWEEESDFEAQRMIPTPRSSRVVRLRSAAAKVFKRLRDGVSTQHVSRGSRPA